MHSLLATINRTIQINKDATLIALIFATMEARCSLHLLEEKTYATLPCHVASPRSINSDDSLKRYNVLLFKVALSKYKLFDS